MTSEITIAVLKDGGKFETFLNDYWDCGDYQGYFEFDKYNVDIRYTKSHRYKITVEAKRGWLQDKSMITEEIIITANRTFTLKLNLVELIKVGETNDNYHYEILGLQTDDITSFFGGNDVFDNVSDYYDYYGNEDETIVFGIKWNDNVSRVVIDCDAVTCDKCGFFHYKKGRRSEIVGYNGNKEVGKLILN